jgi:uncharacterized protein
MTAISFNRDDKFSGNQGMSGLWTNLGDGARSAGAAVVGKVRTTGTTSTLRLAITGLSGAGKTAFLVSVISNLFAMVRGADGNRWDSLPCLRKKLRNPQGQSRLLGIEIERSGAGLTPRFRYEAFRDVLAKGDAWPLSTKKPALITLRLLVQPASKLRAMLGPRVVRLELLDYPGEWLVDLPLLAQSYQSWSAETLLLLREPPRASIAKEFLNFIDTLAPNAPAGEHAEIHGFRLYSEALKRCREEAGLRWLQPGRFLVPGGWEDAPFMHFFPWTPASSSHGTLGAQLRDRFEVYKRQIRKDFFEPHFSAFNRQVVLVDVLGALFAGRAAFEDVRKALGSIGASYARLLEGGRFTGRKIERVAFAATKSDHVDDLQRNNLKSTLQDMVEPAPGSAGSAKSDNRSFHVVSSIRCTIDDNVVDSDERVKRVVKGVPLGDTVQQAFWVGFVPSGAVPENFWTHPFFELPTLQPPTFQGGDTFPIEHLNLDALLADLIGDVL